MKVLVVEDDADIRGALVELMESLGHEAAGAENGLDALGELQRQLADVLLLDLMMPVMNGWELAEALQRDPALARIPIVVYSASNRPPPPGAAAVLPKPGDLDVIASTVERVGAHA